MDTKESKAHNEQIGDPPRISKKPEAKGARSQNAPNIRSVATCGAVRFYSVGLRQDFSVEAPIPQRILASGSLGFWLLQDASAFLKCFCKRRLLQCTVVQKSNPGTKMKSALLIASLLAAAPHMSATLIFSPTGTPNTGSAISSAQVIEITFSIAKTYTNVAVSASLTTSDNFAPFTGTAYLMNQIGPGTTTANQLSSTPFTFVFDSDPNAIHYVSLFSGLTLGPGTYDLVFAAFSSNSGDISRNSSGTYMTDTGAAVLHGGFANGASINTTYAPASAFTPSSFLNNYFFTMTGDIVTPEPGSWLMLLTGFGGLTVIARWRGQSRRKKL